MMSIRMNDCISDTDENSPIHTLPYEIMRDLSRVLDGGDAWVELATWMPDITTHDVDGCRQFSSCHRGSPSEYLLRIWASKGYTILSLYNLFAITRMVRCMRIIRHLVSESHHYLEEYDFSADSSSQPGFTPSNEQQWKWHHVPLAAKRKDHFQRASPVRATGTTQKSWTNPTTTESSSSGNVSDPLWSALRNTLTVPYAELQEATSNFSDKNIVGKGGYGVVYVGEWKHTKIAVKRFMAPGNRCGQIQRERLRQSLQELRTLAKFRHDNISSPLCVLARGSGTLSCLSVYVQWIFGRPSSMSGQYSTSANILLDRHFEPKLGDFGLSCDGRVEVDAEEKSPLIASHVKGTLAYLPPEFITNKILSTKIDVYSFGIVLLEIATGMRPFVDSRSPPSLADYCFSIVNCKNTLKESSAWIDILMDNRTPSVDNQDGIMSWCKGIVYLGLQCANKDRLLRPSFPEILNSLSNLAVFE
ncbi:hypothetical protein KIN20_018336 [Parelaphostrongylus tenuis]|uniref:Protein kinase domain-containing protein n=1 Tax=Parelaphostrongylus tenuis TaxID=148309 RepID=A0AAD5MJS5_PARTN|nr:hypothetical protein KIN20_018336 [Parelaphostrongylus tenuis]